LDKVFSDATEEMKGKESLSILIPEAAYAEAKYRLDIDITGESIDVSSRSQALQIALQLMGSNPMIMQDDSMRSALFKFLELQGVNPNELNMLGKPTQALPQGGSVATPQQGQVGRSTSQMTV
jgi:hypothetical protein